MKRLLHIVIDMNDPKESHVLRSRREAAGVIGVHRNSILKRKYFRKKGIYYLPYNVK
jgi:hypothetical protein